MGNGHYSNRVVIFRLLSPPRVSSLLSVRVDARLSTRREPKQGGSMGPCRSACLSHRSPRAQYGTLLVVSIICAIFTSSRSFPSRPRKAASYRSDIRNDDEQYTAKEQATRYRAFPSLRGLSYTPVQHRVLSPPVQRIYHMENNLVIHLFGFHTAGRNKSSSLGLLVAQVCVSQFASSNPTLHGAHEVRGRCAGVTSRFELRV